MNIYISGISGTGMGPLALMAKAAGYEVSGSDLEKGAIYDELISAGINVHIGPQDGEFLKSELKNHQIDWFAYTSALPEDHAELKIAKEQNLKTTKRDDLTTYLVEKLGLKMIAVAGTHGKTTTTSMIIYAALKLGLKISYIVGTTLGFAPSGSYQKGDEFFIYEADEYDKNFLKFHPWLAVLPAVSYDHPDIYPTIKDYQDAFRQFESQSEIVLETGLSPDKFTLAGAVRRKNAGLAASAIIYMAPNLDQTKIIETLDTFPGVGRRFEKLSDGVYSDYAHHPEEISATLDIANDEAKKLGKKGIVVVYQPHQNTRQHEVKDDYKDAFLKADKLFWIPTYLTRENPELKTLTPQDLINVLSNKQIAEPAELNSELKQALQKYLDDNYLIILMTAGPADTWFRENFAK